MNIKKSIIVVFIGSLLLLASCGKTEVKTQVEGSKVRESTGSVGDSGMPSPSEETRN